MVVGLGLESLVELGLEPLVGLALTRTDTRATARAEARSRVFTPDRLLRCIRRRRPRLTRNDIELISSHLERSARA